MASPSELSGQARQAFEQFRAKLGPPPYDEVALQMAWMDGGGFMHRYYQAGIMIATVDYQKQQELERPPRRRGRFRRRPRSD